MYERFISSSMLTGTLLRAMSVMRLDVEVLDVERVVFDELPARLDLIAHERGEHQVRLGVILRLHLQERALRGVHRGLPQRFRIHLAEAFVTIDGDPLLAGGNEELDELVERFDLDVELLSLRRGLDRAGHRT